MLVNYYFMDNIHFINSTKKAVRIAFDKSLHVKEISVIISKTD